MASADDDLLRDIARRIGLSEVVQRIEHVERKVVGIDERLFRVEANQMSAAEIQRAIHNGILNAPKVQMEPPTLEQMLPTLRTANAIIRQEEQEEADAARGRWIRETTRNPKRLMGVTVGLLGLTGMTNLTQAIEVIRQVAGWLAT